MPIKEVVFTIKLPLKSVWSFMIDRKEVGCLFPGCRQVNILNDRDSIWTIKMSLGPFSRIIEMDAHTTEMVEHERIAWTATHEHLLTSGVVSFRKLSDDETEIHYRLEGHVKGHFSFLQDIVIAEKLGEVTRIFMRKIKERLEYNAANEPTGS
ncbi:MAG TPA: SRPBCC domain-containing protein [Nitrospirota bacterium]|nr:SRPBCC domain-containing protein [Nitrospirota bacterium]